MALPTASALLRLAPAAWVAGQAVPPEEALPLYIRDKVAQTTDERMLIKVQQAEQAAQLAQQRAELARALAGAEEEWLGLSEELEAAVNG
jgi:hypothetical protein